MVNQNVNQMLKTLRTSQTLGPELNFGSQLLAVLRRLQITFLNHIYSTVFCLSTKLYTGESWLLLALSKLHWRLLYFAYTQACQPDR